MWVIMTKQGKTNKKEKKTKKTQTKQQQQFPGISSTAHCKKKRPDSYKARGNGREMNGREMEGKAQLEKEIMFSQKDENSHTARAASFNQWEKGYWRKTNAEWLTKGSGGSSSFSLFFSPFWLFWRTCCFPEEIPENSVDLRPNKTHKSCF